MPRRQRTADVEQEDEDASEQKLRARLFGLMFRHPLDTLVALLASAAASAIVVNALFLQPGRHPAPIFALRRPPVSSAETTGALPRVLPRRRPEAAATAPSRGRGEIVGDIQRELTQRGFYDGPVDGVHGAKTEGAIRAFEHAAGLKSSDIPNEELLQRIRQSPVKANAAHHPDPIAHLIAPSREIMAIQSALSDFGYGQIKVTGLYDTQTRAAIEHFEREQHLPVTGRISAQLKRQLAATTGRPLE